VTADTWQAALSAAGGAVAAVQAVLGARVQNAICLLRPPGHHAMPDRGMGFCIFNSVAIAAEYALAHHGLERVAVVDFDVHHGNGTEAVFVDRRDVLCASVHQQPLYPGTGAFTDVGSGEGQGYTINCPLPPGASDEHFLRCFDEIIIPTLQELYRPELILVSAGYDGYRGDPLAQLNLTANCFHTLTEQLVAVARQSAAAASSSCWKADTTSTFWGCAWRTQCWRFWTARHFILSRQSLSTTVRRPATSTHRSSRCCSFIMPV
jgi:acetoin utilization deacetylase AcuC-like enzyme